MRFYDGEDVHRICDWPALVQALAKAHCGPKPLVERSEIFHQSDGLRQAYLNLPAYQPGVAMSTKLCTIMPGNARMQESPPVIQALVALFDGQDGSPLAIIDGTALTYRKTAADSALGCDLLAVPEPEHLAMLGAGALAPYLIQAHLAVRPSIKTVSIWNRTAEKAHKLAQDLNGKGIKSTAVADPDAAVAQADVISCATSSIVPIVKGASLRPGCHLDLVGSFTPEMRECDDEAVQRGRLFADSWWFAVDQPGDFANPLSRGVIRRSDIEADLFDLCAPGYQLDRQLDDITIFKNGGGAHLDLFAAQFIHKAGTALGA